MFRATPWDAATPSRSSGHFSASWPAPCFNRNQRLIGYRFAWREGRRGYTLEATPPNGDAR
jgi:hypothetical protein